MGRRAYTILALTAVWAVPGCGDSGRPHTVPVTGTVTFAGSPVAGADVTFLGKQGPLAAGRTDEQGRFQLMTFTAGDGAVPGAYLVGISKREKVVDPQNPNDPYPQFRDVLPAKYGNPESSGLTATVDASQRNDIGFALAP